MAIAEILRRSVSSITPLVSRLAHTQPGLQSAALYHQTAGPSSAHLFNKINHFSSSAVSPTPVPRSVWKGPFVDAFLMKLKNKKDLLMNKKIWSRRSVILPEFVGCSFRIHNGKTHIRCKITEAKVGHKFGEFAMTRKRRPKRGNAVQAKKKGKK